MHQHMHLHSQKCFRGAVTSPHSSHKPLQAVSLVLHPQNDLQQHMVTGELEASTSKCGDLEAQQARLQQLVARLEEDLLAAEQRRSNPGESGQDALDGLGGAGPSSFTDDGARLLSVQASV